MRYDQAHVDPRSGAVTWIKKIDSGSLLGVRFLMLTESSRFTGSCGDRRDRVSPHSTTMRSPIMPPCYSTTWRPRREWARTSIDGLGFSILPHRAKLDRGVGARRAPILGRQEREWSGLLPTWKRREERKQEGDGGDFQHAPQPLGFFSPGTEKGDRARHMPGERERVSVCRLRDYVCGSTVPANKCVRACVRTLPAITASRTGDVGRERLYERQSDPGNLMRNWMAVDTRLKRAVLLYTLVLISLCW